MNYIMHFLVYLVHFHQLSVYNNSKGYTVFLLSQNKEHIKGKVTAMGTVTYVSHTTQTYVEQRVRWEEGLTLLNT